jgi:hypothetical protein
MEYKIEEACLEDVDALMELMDQARRTVEDPDWFVADDADYIRKHFQAIIWF